MMMAWIGFALVATGIPLTMAALNVLLYREPRGSQEPPPPVSVLVPARDEEREIGGCIEAVLASTGVTVEMLILDDQSTDRTAEIIDRYAQQDGRVRRLSSTALPKGWNGKQHACWQLAHEARYDHMVYIDADVRIHPALIARLSHALAKPRIGLVSGFPRQRNETVGEWLLLPFIHVLLLGYLPMGFMRLFPTATGFGAACGQVVAVERTAYFGSDGHRAIRRSMHDGVKLPRSFRASGFGTDLVDITHLATVRMYTSFSETWKGLAKNATEGMATYVGLPIWSVLLLGGGVVPFVLPLVWPSEGLAYVPMAACIAFRLLLALRFRHGIGSVLLHPIGVSLLLSIQLQALWFHFRGRAPSWRGRVCTEVLVDERSES